MRTLVVLLILAASTLALFVLMPEIDLEAARGIYPLINFNPTPFQSAMRIVFEAAPFVVVLTYLALYGLRLSGVKVIYAPTARQLTFLVATMAIGPGLLVNLGLKDHSHRPRPVHTREFGGFFAFRPWHSFDGECTANCSFASGEAATNFWLVAPASLVPPPAGPFVIAGALLFATAAAMLRMAFGAHYLSDVVAAALIVLFTVQIMRMLLFRRPGRLDGSIQREALPRVVVVATSSDNG